MNRSPIRLAVCVLVAGLAMGAPSSHAEERLAAEAQPTTVSASPGVVAWSRWVSTDSYALVVRRGTEIEMLPVPRRKVAFDVDLGPGPRGPAAVYSRCDAEQRFPNTLSQTSSYFGAAGCRLRLVDLSGGRERSLSLGSLKGSFYEPAIWGRRIAFVRKIRRRASIYVGTLRGDRVLRPRRVASGWTVRTTGGRAAFRPGPVGLDLERGRLAFTLEGYGAACGVEGGKIGDTRSETWWTDVESKRSRRVAIACTGTRRPHLSAPSLDGGVMSYIRYQRIGDEFRTELHRRVLHTGRERVRCVPPDTRSIAADGQSLAFTGPNGDASPERPEFLVRQAALAELEHCRPG